MEEEGDCLFPISDPFSFLYVNPTDRFLILFFGLRLFVYFTFTPLSLSLSLSFSLSVRLQDKRATEIF